MADPSKNLSLLFQRPTEPLWLPKDDGTTVIDVPNPYLTDRYKPIGAEIQTRFGDDVENHVPLKTVTTPDLSFASGIKRKEAFSLFIPLHREIAGQLTKLFLDQPDAATLMSVAAYARDRLNIYLYQYSLAVAVQHRSDTQDVEIPNIVQMFPDQFVDPSVFPKLREEASVVNTNNRMVIEIPRNYTASEREDEQRLAYFREDIGVNMHHWHWHLVYPGEGDDRVVRKDRRGELFYYMHAQIIARYNVERLCNRLKRVVVLNNLREAVPEAYFPKMIRSSNNRSYPPRTANTLFRDINRTDNNTFVEVGDLERWRDRCLEAIDQGFIVTTSGTRVPLDEEKGIDILGDMIEASQLSPNPKLYGNLHNQGHNVISYCHDPENRYLEDFGVMGDVTTAMRDPIFYRWHGYIDFLFRRHKNTLPAYNASQLGYNGVVVNSVSAKLNRANTTPNILLTYWQKSAVDLKAGLDFGPQGNIFASFTHLQHAPFAFNIDVTNNTGAVKRGTCRIFIAPKIDERGTAFAFKEQRLLVVELDKFTVNLNPGVNNIVRRSDQSSVTIPYERSFRAIGTNNQPTQAAQLATFRFCGCGWPAHMLLPKGSPEGLKFDLFAMISDFAGDTVNQEFDENKDCNDAHSFCGLKDRKYPDKRSMGYPFDRNHTAATIQQFVAANTNMKLGEVTIKFTDTVIAKT